MSEEPKESSGLRRNGADYSKPVQVAEPHNSRNGTCADRAVIGAALQRGGLNVVAPLRKKTGVGTAYSRPPEIEASLASLDAPPIEEVARRAAIDDPGDHEWGFSNSPHRSGHAGFRQPTTRRSSSVAIESAGELAGCAASAIVTFVRSPTPSFPTSPSTFPLAALSPATSAYALRALSHRRRR